MMKAAILFLLAIVPAVWAGHCDAESNTIDKNGFEVGETTGGLPHGWKLLKEPETRIVESGYEEVHAFEGKRMLLFEERGTKIATKLSTKDVDYIWITFQFLALTHGSIVVEVGPEDWEQRQTLKANRHKKWTDAVFAFPAQAEDSLDVRMFTEGHGILVDDLRISAVRGTMTAVLPPLVAVGDFVGVNVTVKNMGHEDVATIRSRMHLDSSLDCIEDSLEILESSGKFRNKRTICSTRGVNLPDAKVQCGQSVVMRYAVQALKSGTKEIEPSFSIEDMADGLLETKVKPWNFVVQQASHPIPSPTQRLVNGGFEDNKLHGLSAVEVSQLDMFGWQSSTGSVNLWKSGKEGIESVEGSQFVKLEAMQSIYQDLDLPPGSHFFWMLKHRGFEGKAKVAVKIGPTHLPDDQLEVDSGSAEWNTVAGAYHVPKDQRVTRFKIVSLSREVELLLDDIKIADHSSSFLRRRI